MYKYRSVKLNFSCPPSCCCGSQQLRNWHHLTCDTQLYLNEMGDLYCTKYNKGCDSYFIKDAQFQCAKAKKNNESWYQYKTPSQFFMALSQAMQAAEFTLKDHDLNEFTRNLTEQIGQRWYQ